MNKILVNNKEKEIIFKNDKYEFQESGTFSLDIENGDKDIFLVVLDNVKVVLNILSKNSHLNFYIHILENATLVLNHLIIDGSTGINTNLDKINANFELNYSILSNKNSKNLISVKHNFSKTNAVLRNHGFSKNHANLIFDVSAYINKEAYKCISKQDNQIIENENSLSQINPNLYIDNYDVEASHSAYVGEFKEEHLFYLMSRGLTEEISKFLLLKSFLIGSFDLEDDIKEKYYHEVIKYFNKEV